MMIFMPTSHVVYNDVIYSEIMYIYWKPVFFMTVSFTASLYQSKSLLKRIIRTDANHNFSALYNFFLHFFVRITFYTLLHYFTTVCPLSLSGIFFCKKKLYERNKMK